MVSGRSRPRLWLFAVCVAAVRRHPRLTDVGRRCLGDGTSWRTKDGFSGETADYKLVHTHYQKTLAIVDKKIFGQLTDVTAQKQRLLQEHKACLQMFDMKVEPLLGADDPCWEPFVKAYVQSSCTIIEGALLHAMTDVKSAGKMKAFALGQKKKAEALNIFEGLDVWTSMMPAIPKIVQDAENMVRFA